jgi:acyl-CoA synthetase (AMP-forming)/AMP-acid ligase II
MEVLMQKQGKGFSTLVELLKYRAKYQKDKTAYIFLVDGETQEVKLTYGELDRQAMAIAAALQEKFAPGERALLLYPSGLEFISAFFGCLYAGIIAVPAYPPNPNQLDVSIKKLQGIMNNCTPKTILTTKELLDLAKLIFPQYPELKKTEWLASDKIDLGLSDKWQKTKIDGETLAFLQYTSGSTGFPKGVMVSHENIMYNERMMYEACKYTKNVIFMNWLPLYHDLGLIGHILATVYVGSHCIIMSPIAFLQKPVRWLKAISRYKATGSGAPNFAYDLCVRKITPEQRQQLDLTCWNIAVNAAEFVLKETLERFAEVFEPCGFQKKAFFQAYGMAEATLYISGQWVVESNSIKTCEVQKTALENDIIILSKEDKDNTKIFVSAGRPCMEQKNVIVDHEFLTLCSENQTGEIWAAGKSIAKGYWKMPEQTEEIFNAYLVDTGEGPFLKTGDLGFIKDGELFITGRIKDLIIIRGMNHYPQDIELTVEKSHEALRPGCCAAFSVDVENEERLVVIQEVRPDHAKDLNKNEVMERIRESLATQHDLQVYAIVLVEAKTIPKTSSGKIQRRLCKEMFLKQMNSEKKGNA